MINDIIIMGDYNQNIVSKEIQLFYKEISVQDIYHTYNNIPLQLMDKTYIRGSKPIDSIVISLGITEYIEGCKLLSHTKVIISDHRSYLININFEAYFDE